MSITLNDKETDGHFGKQPIFGIDDSIDSLIIFNRLYMHSFFYDVNMEPRNLVLGTISVLVVLATATMVVTPIR